MLSASCIKLIIIVTIIKEDRKIILENNGFRVSIMGTADVFRMVQQHQLSSRSAHSIHKIDSFSSGEEEQEEEALPGDRRGKSLRQTESGQQG